MNGEGRAEKWIATGLAELARSGIDGVRVEVLAKQLGVTKGGFYRQFKDRRALLEAMLNSWVEGRVEAIEQQMDLHGESPEQKLHSVIGLFTRRVNAQGIGIELAVRQWARSDKMAEVAVAQVDAARVRLVTPLYRTMGFSSEQAEARALLFYSFLFGQSLLLVGTSPARRKALIQACADALIQRAGGAIAQAT
jgi:AcrR family transcriptional regulator